MAGSHTETTSAARGTKIREDFGRDRGDSIPGQDMAEMKNGKLKGDAMSLDHSIKGGKVPRE